MHSLPYNSALLVIDVQNSCNAPIEGGNRNNPEMERNIVRLEREWRTSGRPVFRVQHDLVTPESPKGETILHPRRHETVFGSRLEADLWQQGVSTLVIVGLATDRCISTAARMATSLGFKAYVVSDATATFDRIGPDGRRYRAEDMHAVALAGLNGEFATIVDTQTVMRSLGELAA